MPTNSRFISLVFAVVLLTACSPDQHDDQRTKASMNAFALVDNNLADSCRIVLTTLEQTDQEDSISQYQQAVLNDKNALPNLEKLGWALIAKARTSYDTGYYKLAEQAAQCIQQKQENSSAALLLKGHVLHNLHRFKAAEVLARQLIAQRGSWFEYALLGDVLLEQGQLEAAADAYQTMMNQRPGPQAYTRAAHLRWLKGDLPGAIEMMAMSVQALGARAGEASAWTEVRLALYLFEAGEFDRAQNIIKRVRSLHKNYAPALLAQGRIDLALGKPLQALQVLSKAAKLNPLVEYQWALIEALQQNQLFEQAGIIQSQLMQTGALDDRRTYALYLASTNQDVDTAVKLAKQELENRQDVFSQDALAWSFYAAGQIPEALYHMKHAVAEGTQNARMFLY